MLASSELITEAFLDDPETVFELKTDAPAAVRKGNEVRTIVAKNQGHLKFSVPGQSVPLAEAFVRKGMEMIDAELVHSAVHPKHRLAVGKTVFLNRNLTLGIPSRINQISMHVLIGRLCMIT